MKDGNEPHTFLLAEDYGTLCVQAITAIRRIFGNDTKITTARTTVEVLKQFNLKSDFDYILLDIDLADDSTHHSIVPSIKENYEGVIIGIVNVANHESECEKMLRAGCRYAVTKGKGLVNLLLKLNEEENS